MKNLLLQFLLIFTVLCSAAQAAPVSNAVKPFQFAFIDQLAIGDDLQLQKDIEKIEKKNLAFVVINGLKARTEPCNDSIYQQRKNRLDESNVAIILSLSGDDWVHCTNESGQSLAFEKLQHLRDMLAEDTSSLGTKKITLIRQSTGIKFRNFSENAYWIHNNILFANIHLPAENNHYSSAAGRNNEFEDRATANRNWLQRLFTLAHRNKLRGIVLFSDGNPFELPQPSPQETFRDGFSEIRKQLTTLSSRFSGRVLFVHGDAHTLSNRITWKGNLGIIGIDQGWLEIGVYPNSNTLFSIGKPPRSDKSKKKK